MRKQFYIRGIAMSRVAKIAKQIEDVTAEQERILDAADKAEGGARELTADESTRFDTLAVQKTGLKTQLKRASELENDRAEASEAARPRIVQDPYIPSNVAAMNGKPRIFAQPRRHGRLQAFKGEHAAERAEAAGMWAIATLYGNLPGFDANTALRARNWCMENGVIVEQAERQAATLNLTNNSGAGFFVPNVIDNAILELAEQYGVFRQHAEVVNMTSETWSGPRWIGGMTAYWVAEQTAPTQSDPSWDHVTLTARVLAAMSKMTRELNDDSIIDLGDKVAMSMALAFAYAEDNAGFNGTGAATYGGIYGLMPKLTATAASLYTAATGNTTPATLDLADFIGCMGSLPLYPNIQPKWFMSKEVWAASVVPLTLAAGGTVPSDINGSQGLTFLGYPVVISQVMPLVAAATTGTVPIAFGDLSLAAKLGNRRGLTVESGLINDDFTKRLMTIMGWSRVDINVHTVVDPRDNTKKGPIIGLKLA
jgi:HK97 family phage major capsid protein